MITLRQTATFKKALYAFSLIIADDYFASNRNFIYIGIWLCNIIADDYFASNRNLDLIFLP